MRNVKAKVRKLLKGIIDDTLLVDYFGEIVKYCINNDIHEFDIVLKQNVYPVLAKKFNKSPLAIETEMVKTLKKEWKTIDFDLYKERFRYDKKITVKKLLILLISNIKNQ